MRQPTPWQYLVLCAYRGRPLVRDQDALPQPPGFEELFAALKAAAVAEPTRVTTSLVTGTTPADDEDMDELITLDTAAEVTGRSRRTLERRIEAGALQAHRDGRSVRVRRGDLEVIR